MAVSWAVRRTLLVPIRGARPNRATMASSDSNGAISPGNTRASRGSSRGKTAPIAVSLSLIDTLHNRWVQFLRSIDPGAYGRTVVHPENGPMSLIEMLQLYSWHGRHHTAHITGLRQRMGW